MGCVSVRHQPGGICGPQMALAVGA